MSLPHIFTTDKSEARIYAVAASKLARVCSEALRHNPEPILVVVASGRSNDIAKKGTVISKLSNFLPIFMFL